MPQRRGRAECFDKSTMKSSSSCAESCRRRRGGAEFPHGPREGEDRSSDNATRGKRQTDRREDAPFARAESPRDILKARVHFFKRSLRRAHQAVETT